MNVLLTGANGFLGRYIQITNPGISFDTLGLADCYFNIDLSSEVPYFNQEYLKVIHTAGLAHYSPVNKKEENQFYEVNVKGTRNLLKGIEATGYLPGFLIFISTVAVYGIDTGENLDETAQLLGKSPYALSKIMAEQLILEWGQKNGVNVLMIRLPLLAGTDPPGNLGSMTRAIRRGFYFRIGDGFARRSMVLAEDVARFIMNCPNITGIYNLTDGYHPSIKELDEEIGKQTGRRIKCIPFNTAQRLAKIGDVIKVFPLNSTRLSKLTSSLTFSDEKARKELGWSPNPVIGNFKLFADQKNMVKHD